MHVEYRVRVPEVLSRRTGAARQLVAKALNVEPDVPGQFGPLLHLDPSGRYADGLAPIRIDTLSSQTIVVYGVGGPAVEWLSANGHRVSATLAKYFGGAHLLDEQRKYGKCGLRVGNALRKHIIYSLVWQRSAHREVREDLVADRFDAPRIVKRVEVAIRRGIERQCDLLGCDVPEYMLGDIVVERSVPIPVKEQKWFGCARVTFRSDLIFEGPWHVGYLCARGHGSIRLDRSVSPL